MGKLCAVLAVLFLLGAGTDDDLGCCPHGCPEPAVCPPGYAPPPVNECAHNLFRCEWLDWH